MYAFDVYVTSSEDVERPIFVGQGKYTPPGAAENFLATTLPELARSAAYDSDTSSCLSKAAVSVIEMEKAPGPSSPEFTYMADALRIYA
jgi:hypothetical protein